MPIKSPVWSNIFFVFPLILSLYYHLFAYSILILLVIIISTAYHLSNQKKFGLLDKIFAYLLIAYNLYLCYLSNFKQPYFFIALFFVIIGLYYLYIKKRDDYEWHLSSALITIFCVLAFVI